MYTHTSSRSLVVFWATLLIVLASVRSITASCVSENVHVAFYGKPGGYNVANWQVIPGQPVGLPITIIDVTTGINAYIAANPGTTQATVSTSLAGISDPFPGVVKTLTIVFPDGTMAAGQEGRTIRIQSLSHCPDSRSAERLLEGITVLPRDAAKSDVNSTVQIPTKYALSSSSCVLSGNTFSPGRAYWGVPSQAGITNAVLLDVSSYIPELTSDGYGWLISQTYFATLGISDPDYGVVKTFFWYSENACFSPFAMLFLEGTQYCALPYQLQGTLGS